MDLNVNKKDSSLWITAKRDYLQQIIWQLTSYKYISHEHTFIIWSQKEERCRFPNKTWATQDSNPASWIAAIGANHYATPHPPVCTFLIKKVQCHPFLYHMSFNSSPRLCHGNRFLLATMSVNVCACTQKPRLQKICKIF